MATRAMRQIMTVAALVLAGCGTVEPKIVSVTLDTIQISCQTNSCRSHDAVADLAQAHCKKYGLNAQQA
jgi:hypothetical protein